MARLTKVQVYDIVRLLKNSNDKLDIVENLSTYLSDNSCVYSLDILYQCNHVTLIRQKENNSKFILELKTKGHIEKKNNKELARLNKPVPL